MTELERYEFDRLGYIIIRDMLSADEVSRLSGAIDHLEEHALAHISEPPRVKSAWGSEYHRSESHGYHATGSKDRGQTLMVEDFWNADEAFHFLIDHERTNAYIENVVAGRYTINNSELRIRYPGNATGTHMGGPADHKYRYSYTGGRIDCMMVRMIYFVHDVHAGQGEFCVVPGTHKTNMPSPYTVSVDEEPGMIGLEVEAGDAILFTENLRHGGFTNKSDQTRKTLHVGYGPYWMMSQNIATMDQPQHVMPETRAKLTERQVALLQAWSPQT